MDDTTRQGLAGLLVRLLPSDGSTMGNQSLRERFIEAAKAAGHKNTGSALDVAFEALREELIQNGVLAKGKGRGGSVRRVQADDASAFSLGVQAPAAAEDAPTRPAKAKAGAPARTTASDGEPQVLSYRHANKRKNNPQVGLVNETTDPPTPKTVWKYDPHIDPALSFDMGRAGIEKLIDDALATGDEKEMRAALEQLKRSSSAYLNWAGKAERTSFEIDTVSLHVHERIDPMSILAAVSKQIKDAREGKRGGIQPGLFEAPFESLPLREAVDFYKHERGWSNRLVAGDSLLVMNSLIQKESMAGQVQMIYFDPPYGITYGSNFQPFVNRRDVKDRKDEDLTQEPEMLKAFRDTWELDVHSYLTYLRDRLLLAATLLHESGSVFVQISDQNVHLVRSLIGEVFGEQNFYAQIAFFTTPGLASKGINKSIDYLLWYAKNKEKMKFNPVYLPKEAGTGVGGNYNRIEYADGSRRPLSGTEKDGPLTLADGSRLFLRDNATSGAFRENTTIDYAFRSATYHPGDNRCWKTTKEGLDRLTRANRLEATSGSLYYVRYIDDFPVVELSNSWQDTSSSFMPDKVYVVQTTRKVIERCMLLTTGPGDLVLDPTCGSGTTAVVAEKWGRRWITCDTSRVAVTLAKQRLVTASYDYYVLRYPHEGLKSGFIYKTVPHVTLGSIANNPEIDDIYERMYPEVEVALRELNKTLMSMSSSRKSDSGSQHSREQRTEELRDWEVPFAFPTDWPPAARKPFDAFHAGREAIQKRIDASIAAHADQETLFEQPEKSKTKMRITGPFTVEAVPFPTVLSLNEAEQPAEADAAIARSGESARQHSWRDELLKTGIRGKGGQMLRFASMETLAGTVCLHASGTLDSGERVVISFGPEHGALEQRQVEHALREAGELFPLPKMVVFCAFEFDPEAAKDIDAVKGITALKAKMNADLLTEDLKKARSSNQSFWLMGQPDVELRQRKDGKFEIEVNGFDYFDTVRGELVSGGKSKIAMWLLDTDYDDRSLFPRQVFFPMAGKGEGWMKLKKDIRAELDESQLDKFHGTVSLPFEPGENRKVAVKIVDDRGIESIKVISLA